jgi:hypothetical protein
MANTISKTTIEDGPRNLVQLVNIVGDGSGDESSTLLVDRSAFTPTTGTKTVVDRIEGHLSGFTAALSFDASADLTVARLPDGHPFEFDWKRVGGVASTKAGTGANGDILITTTSLGASDGGTFTLFMRKS